MARSFWVTSSMLPVRVSITAPTCSCAGALKGCPSTSTLPLTGCALSSEPGTGAGRIGAAGGANGGRAAGGSATGTVVFVLLLLRLASAWLALTAEVASSRPVAVALRTLRALHSQTAKRDSNAYRTGFQ